MEVCLLPTSTIYSLSFGWSLQLIGAALSPQPPRNLVDTVTVSIASKRKVYHLLSLTSHDISNHTDAL